MEGGPAARGARVHASGDPGRALTAAELPALRNGRVLEELGVPAGQSTPPTDAQRAAYFLSMPPPEAAAAVAQGHFGTAAAAADGRARALAEAVVAEGGLGSAVSDAVRSGNLADAAAFCRQDAEAATGPAAARLRSAAERLEHAEFVHQGAEQLRFTQRMASAGVSPLQAPPTMTQLQAYFQTLGGARATAAVAAYRDYTSAFCQHVQDRARGGSASAGVSYGGTGDTATRPRHVMDDAQLSSTGRRILDCDGYAYLAERLLGPDGAGFHQPHGGGFCSVGPEAGTPGPGHSMLLLERGDERVWVSNDHAVVLSSNPGLRSPPEEIADMQRDVSVSFRNAGVRSISPHQGSTPLEARTHRHRGVDSWPETLPPLWSARP